MLKDTSKTPPGHELPQEIQRKLKADEGFVVLIRQIVCGYFGIPVAELLRDEKKRGPGGKSSRRASRAKQVVCYIAKRLCPKMTNGFIGQVLGGFTPATVLYNVRTVEQECLLDARAHTQVATIIHVVMQRGHELGEFWGAVDKEYYFVDLNNITVLRVSNHQALVFTGIPRGLVDKIKEQYFPQAGAQLRDFSGTGLCVFEKRV